MRKILTVALLLLCPVASWAPLALLPHPAVAAAAAKADKKTDAPFVKLPKALTVKPNRYFTIKPDTNCPNLKWIVPDGLDSLDPNIPVKDGNLKILIGDAGVYVVQCYGALADQASDIASCTITIGTPPPPIPPIPPGPPSPLTPAFQAGYNLDADADKTTSLKLLQALYAAMAKDAPNWSSVTTNAQAAAEIASIVQAPTGLPDKTKVQNLRKAIAAEMAKAFGTAVAPIALAVVASELSAIASGLQGVK